MDNSDFSIASLYLAYFGRPADPQGLAYWHNVANGSGGLAAVSAEFGRSAEFQAAVAGQTTSVVVNYFFHTLFGHDADAAGLQYWNGVLAANPNSLAAVTQGIMNGATGADRVALDAKLVVSTAFTLMVDTPQEVAAYSGTNANAQAKTFIAAVQDVPSMTDALAHLGQAVPNGTIVGVAPHADLPVYG